MAAQVPGVVFLEPLGKVDANRAEISGPPPLYRKVAGERYLPWMENDSARRALRLYAVAWRLLDTSGNPQRQPRDYYIALVPGGNHAAVGFRIQTESGVQEHRRHAYILLGPEPFRFETTLLHETGHVAMAMLAGGRQLPRTDVASIPHSTAALSDRATAFGEGWAIHLETLAAHTATEAGPRRRYHREGILFGDGPYPAVEYFRHAADLTSYSQNLARYTDVRDNNFAFESAYRRPDYLRVQLEKARDFAALRDANQLLQSEGFHASFFFLFLMRGEGKPSEELIAARQERLLRAMAAAFESAKMEESTPWLLHLATQYMRLFPDEKMAIIDALNDVSHGVFADPAAAAIWRDHYLAALRLDLKNLNREGITAARKRWRERVAANPAVLFSRLGPQLRCEVKSVSIKLEALGGTEPLVFDVNTAEEGVLRLIPGITEEQIARWLAERARQPFASLEDFRKRGGPAGGC